MSPPFPPDHSPDHHRLPPSISDVMAELKVQTPMLRELHRTLHGDLPDGSDGMKARQLRTEETVKEHVERFARNDKLIRNGLIGAASSVALAVLGLVLTPNALSKLAAFLGASQPPPSAHP
jgi:hypothetical protein